MSEHNAVVGIYNSHTDAEAAIKELQKHSIGIPTNSIVEYEMALKSDKFLVMAHGTADEVATAKRILETTGAAHITAHQGVLTP
jgi:hypothetical protein